MRRFRVDTLPAPGARLSLDEAASHHLLHVIRHPRGARLLLFDGSGHQVEAVLVDGSDGAVVEIVSPPRPAAPEHPLHLVLGIPKGPALDRALRMATEAGATHLHLVQAARSVPRKDKTDRWQRIVSAAAQQCGRADLPELLALASLVEVLDRVLPDDRRVAVPGAAPLPRATGPAAVAVGPEGGFAPDELDRLQDRGWIAAGLGRWVLRTDTAVAAALAATAPL